MSEQIRSFLLQHKVNKLKDISQLNIKEVDTRAIIDEIVNKTIIDSDAKILKGVKRIISNTLINRAIGEHKDQ